MSSPAPVIEQLPPRLEYAAGHLEPPAERLLRRILAIASIVYGGAALASTMLHVALAKGWLRSPPAVRWSFGSDWSVIWTIAQAIAMIALLIGGVLLLRRRRASIIILRCALLLAIALPILGTGIVYYTVPESRSRWSTPASAAYNTLEHFTRIFPPLLLLLLTFGPLMPRSD